MESIGANGRLARVGRLCHRRRWLVLFGWVVAVAAGVLATGPVFAGMPDDFLPGDFEAFEAVRVLERDSDRGGTVAAVVDRVDPGAAPTREIVLRGAAALDGIEGVAEVRHPYVEGPATAGFVAGDGRALLIEVTLDRMEDERTADA